MRFILGILYIIVIVWAVLDVLKSNRSGEQKIIWILVIIFFPIAGSVIYYLVSRNIIKM